MSRLPLRLRSLLLPVGVALLVALAFALPPIAQSPLYHDFADQRALWRLPHAMDVLSNLPFAVVGLALLRAAGRPWREGHAIERALLGLTGAGLLCTAIASAAYHWAPDDARLLGDRAAMLLPFAGLLGLAACRDTARRGAALALAVAVAGVLALAAWRATGDLGPWSVLQGGGLLLLSGLATMPSPHAVPVRWQLVVAGYVLAKALELGDGVVYAATHHMTSGHSLKHVVAALALLPVLAAARTVTGHGQNRRDAGLRALTREERRP
jgi:hypothetical protein